MKTINYQVLIVDDEMPNLESLSRILRSEGYQVEIFSDPTKALDRVRKGNVDLILTDLRMDRMDGLELLETIKVLDSSIETILMTAYGTVEVAVQAIKKGAYDFITKPLQRLQVIKTVEKALEKRKLVQENLALRDYLRSHNSQRGIEILGKSAAVSNMLEIADQAAKSQASVLIEGESGTGKGILAEYLHRQSDRQQGVFVKINCTAIPENLLEAELFGFEPGAFTGAVKRKKGRVELADQGTLFLDEIGIAPLTLQSKLLRFLQEGEFERLGSNETLKVDARVISATNVNLKKAIEQGQLREDLFYRLNVIHVKVPALRDRREDIEILAQNFLESSSKKNDRPLPLLTPDAKKALEEYHWPGNIRELQNLMERIVVLNKTGVIELVDLPFEVSQLTPQKKTMSIPIGTSLKEIESMMFEETLRTTHGDKKLAAKLLGIHPRTIYRFLESQEEKDHSDI